MLPADDEVERFCNRVAAEFLIPEYKLQERWASDDEVKDIMREQNTEFGYAS